MRRRRLIITIDGPSGAGKSTTARGLARKLGYVYIDTGAMYRAVAFEAKDKAAELKDEETLSQWVSSLKIAFSNQQGEVRVFCNGRDVSQEIRTPAVSLLSSEISKRRGVREALVRMQRSLGKGGGVVFEGRDTGTVVFPGADVKFYLDARPEERARRRHEELQKRGMPADFDRTLKEVLQRDDNDMGRILAPLRKAEDAILIDSTDRSAEEVVEAMVLHVFEKNIREVDKEER